MKASKTSKGLLERALAFHRAGRKKEAEGLYAQAISRDARNHEALFGLSVLSFDAGRYQEWIQYLERAVDVCPTHPKYLNNLGEAYRRQGKLELAIATFTRLLADQPDFAEARQNYAMTLISAGAIAEALPELERAADLCPSNPILFVSRARVLLELHRPVEAIASARHAIQLAPSLASGHRHLGYALEANGSKGGAIASYRRAVELDPSDHVAHSSLIVAMLTSPKHDAWTLCAETRAWERLHAEPLRKHVRPHSNDKDPERRLRIGYVSPDFRAHAIQQFMVPLLQHHDESAVEIFLYSSVGRPDAETEWYRAFVGDRFRDIRIMDDVQAADLVRRDRIDILVDLALHGPGGRLRLFACKPAPVQITWLGYAGTTGLDTIDYRITDPFVDPPGTDTRVYSETCLYVPETSWCYSSLDSSREVSPLPALAAGHITFGCQNNHRKWHPGLLALWARVLHEVAGARIFLYAEEHAHGGLQKAFAESGIRTDRIELGGRVSRPEYFERYHRIDIGLDTFPYNGGTTTLDAAWMGVPVVTLTGGTAVQRVGTCIAMNLGLPELVATSTDDYVEKAIALARDLERLSGLRGQLRDRLGRSPLGDPHRFARHLEAAYRDAWHRYCVQHQS